MLLNRTVIMVRDGLHHDGLIRQCPLMLLLLIMMMNRCSSVFSSWRRNDVNGSW